MMRLLKKIINYAKECLIFVLCIVIMPFFLALAIVLIPYALYSYIMDQYKMIKIKNKGYNFIFYLSRDNDFDNYVIESLKNCSYINLFYSADYKDYPGFADELCIKSLKEKHIVFTFNKAHSKFKYSKVKVDNIIKKIKEYDRRLSKGIPVNKMSELNLCNHRDGFGHIQDQSNNLVHGYKENFPQKIEEEGKVSSILKSIYITAMVILIIISYLRQFIG